MTESIGPLIVYAALVVLGMVATIALSWLLGQRHRDPLRDVPYESGVQPSGTARMRFGAHFYLVGVFFILFDVEAAILFAWAAAFRELGWRGYFGALAFLVTLALGLVWLWKEGGLDWHPRAGDVRPSAPPVRR